MTLQNSITGNSIKLGIDIGGTFTDAAIELADQRFTAKTLTTHTNPDDGVLAAMDLVLVQAGVEISDLDLVVHGTTLATNALIERKGAKTAMLTTAGFRDVVEIGQEYRFDLFDLFLELPAPLVPRDLRIPIRERLGAGGRLLMPLDEEDVVKAIDRLRQADVESVAVCLMHSYANVAHEVRVAKMIRAALPDISVSISGEVAPEMREFERFCTACANAYVQPKMAAYLLRLDERLKGKGLNCPLLMMLSGGGLTDIATAAAFPIRLVESGPAGGALFSASIAAENGLLDVVSFDMGGTTAKLCLIDNGKPQTSRTFEVARVYKHKKGSGTPVRIPVIDMVEIGSGGGSLAKLDSLGRVTVGPESAGSEPGPAAFGRGGDQPAVTDANLLLGKINPAGFAGGKFPLDLHASETAMTEHICKKLAAPTPEASAAVVEIVEENMAAAARVHAAESGKEIRNRVLIGFGGGAPLHVANVMAKLGMKQFLVPTGAGVGSAVGFLRAPVSYEVVRSLHQPLASFDADIVNTSLEEMKDTATRIVEPAALDQPLTEVRSASMRYVGQGHEITVPVPCHRLSQQDNASLREAFETKYREIYHRNVPGAEVEVITWSVLVTAPVPDVGVFEALPDSYNPEPNSFRTVFETRPLAQVDYAVFWRPDLEPGAQIVGPAAIEEQETTTILPRGMQATILGSGAILGCLVSDQKLSEDSLGEPAQEKTNA